MNLTIDIGNTLTKAVLFEHGRIAAKESFVGTQTADFETIFEKYDIERGMVASTKVIDEQLRKYLTTECNRNVEILDYRTPVPVKNMYATPRTLGMDRLAGAVGAATLFPQRNVLIVDFGTAITFDVVSAEGEYLGGNISPGLKLRFEALHGHTDMLPEGHSAGSTGTLGRTTAEAVGNGVTDGICYEIEGYISRLGAKFDNLVTIFTGGDANYFEKKYKNTIFANLYLVSIGLNRIIEYNAIEKNTI